MEKLLSKLSRKPSNVDEMEMKESGWYDARDKIFNHLENDKTLEKLIKKFNFIDDHLKLTRSTRDLKISFHVLESTYGYRYVYARVNFLINGKRKDFRKYMGKEEEVDMENIDLNKLRKYFFDMLKNYLEYAE